MVQGREKGFFIAGQTGIIHFPEKTPGYLDTISPSVKLLDNLGRNVIRPSGYCSSAILVRIPRQGS